MTHAVHTRSLVRVGAVVSPNPTPQFFTLMQVELLLALKVTPSTHNWHTQFDTLDAAATACEPARHGVMGLHTVWPGSSW